MFRGLFFSLILHLSILLLMIFGIPFLPEKNLNTEYAIVTEIVNISELTNIKVRPKETKIKEEIKQPAAPKAIDKPKPKDLPTEAKDAEKLPKELIKDSKEVKKEEVKKEEAKKEEVKKPKKKDDSFDKVILKSLDAEKKKKQDKKIDKDFSELTDALKGETNKDYNPDLPLTLNETQNIKDIINNNWNNGAFVGSPEAKGMQVSLIIDLDMEGNVLSVKAERASHSSPYYKVFVESTIRAVKKSSPLKNLNKEKYGSWKQIKLKFDSSGMIY